MTDAKMEPAANKLKTAQPGKWKAPSEGWIKINVDASLEINKSTCAIACIARNEVSEVLWAHIVPEVNCQDVPEAEAKACLLGL
jgi:hypothetical protein